MPPPDDEVTEDMLCHHDEPEIDDSEALEQYLKDLRVAIDAFGPGEG